jgi:hypothetical protein
VAGLVMFGLVVSNSSEARCGRRRRPVGEEFFRFAGAGEYALLFGFAGGLVELLDERGRVGEVEIYGCGFERRCRTRLDCRFPLGWIRVWFVPA